MRLSRLIADLPITLLSGDGACEISSITDDSRKVCAGSLFIARPDPKGGAGGGAFVAQAIASGAVAVLVNSAPTEKLSATVLTLKSSVVFDQSIAGFLANVFYENPLSKIKVVAVTGTNGKTTTATLTQQLLNGRGVKCGMIGTVSVDCGLGAKPAELTTPGAVELIELFAQMVKNGCQACAIEASSHALDQGRVGMIPFCAAAFTNLTGDHLDYHGTMENYGLAKKKLFDGLPASATAIVNGIDAWGARMLADCKTQNKWFAGTLADQLEDTQRDGSEAQAHHMPLVFEPSRGASHTWLSFAASARSTAGTQAIFSGPWGEADAFLPLAGDHNLMNALQAMALAHVVLPLEGTELQKQIASLKAVPGRLELVGAGGGISNPTVLVDYAHTHDAIENVARALRPLVDEAQGKLIIVFGCGGDRDKTKRPKMARVACEYGDVIVITSDNPRTEDAQTIIDDILVGVTKKEKVKVVIDRAEAIAQAIKQARTQDTVLICGKGHEDYQIIGKTKHHFDDREEAAKALRARLK